MMRRSLLSAAALAAGAVGGAVLGYLAERTVVDPAVEPGPDRDLTRAERRDVRSFDGTRLTVLSSGPSDAPCIVLVHGLSLSHEIWAAQRAGLEHGFRVVTVDLRGHGDSDDAANGNYSTEALGADVAAVLDELGARRCVVAGHSMGGMALLAALSGRPELLNRQVAGVVLINTAAAAVISGLRGGSVAAGIAFVRERALSTRVGRAIYGGLDEDGRPRGNDIATLVTRTLGVGADSPDPAVFKLRRLILNSRPHVAGEMWRTAGTVDLMDAAAGLPVPVLIIAGARDRVLPPLHSRRLAEAIADAELVELEGVGHVAMMERPDEVTALLAGFAQRVIGGPGEAERGGPR